MGGVRIRIQGEGEGWVVVMTMVASIGRNDKSSYPRTAPHIMHQWTQHQWSTSPINRETTLIDVVSSSFRKLRALKRARMYQHTHYTRFLLYKGHAKNATCISQTQQPNAFQYTHTISSKLPLTEISWRIEEQKNRRKEEQKNIKNEHLPNINSEYTSNRFWIWFRNCWIIDENSFNT